MKESFTDLDKILCKYQALSEAVEKGEDTDDLVSDINTFAEDVDLSYLKDEVPSAIKQSLEGVERVASIVLAMKEFSHPGTKEKTSIDINKAIKNTIIVARNEWNYVAEMVTDFDPALPLVLCLPGDFNQVILNIIINAAHAIGDVLGDGSKEKGTITVSTCHDGDCVDIRIKDTGKGIPEECQSRIFDPFFTTKKVGKGTGQGLAIAHSTIVDKHGGSITFETEVGKGTEFVVRLPIGQKD